MVGHIFDKGNFDPDNADWVTNFQVVLPQWRDYWRFERESEIIRKVDL
jgi:hypothetical protein